MGSGASTTAPPAPPRSPLQGRWRGEAAFPPELGPAKDMRARRLRKRVLMTRRQVQIAAEGWGFGDSLDDLPMARALNLYALVPATHIAYKGALRFSFLSHHGVIVEGGDVVEVSMAGEETVVARAPLLDFVRRAAVNQSALYVVEYAPADPSDLVLRRAEYAQGRWAYDPGLVSSANCEGVAAWICTGMLWSCQVDAVRAAVARGVTEPGAAVSDAAGAVAAQLRRATGRDHDAEAGDDDSDEDADVIVRAAAHEALRPVAEENAQLRALAAEAERLYKPRRRQRSKAGCVCGRSACPRIIQWGATLADTWRSVRGDATCPVEGPCAEAGKAACDFHAPFEPVARDAAGDLRFVHATAQPEDAEEMAAARRVAAAFEREDLLLRSDVELRAALAHVGRDPRRAALIDAALREHAELARHMADLRLRGGRAPRAAPRALRAPRRSPRGPRASPSPRAPRAPRAVRRSLRTHMHKHKRASSPAARRLSTSTRTSTRQARN